VKELRLAGISTIEAANAFLPSFAANYNGRFAKSPARDKDLHRLLDPRQDLDQVLCWREQRQVSHQLVVNYSRLKLTLKPEGIAVRLRGKMIDIYDFPDGRLEVRWKGMSLPYSAFDKLQRRKDSGLDQGTARPPTPLQSNSGWTTTIKPEAGHSKRSAPFKLLKPPN
jgi:hypothetical protein